MSEERSAQNAGEPGRRRGRPTTHRLQHVEVEWEDATHLNDDGCELEHVLDHFTLESRTTTGWLAGEDEKRLVVVSDIIRSGDTLRVSVGWTIPKAWITAIRTGNGARQRRAVQDAPRPTRSASPNARRGAGQRRHDRELPSSAGLRDLASQADHQERDQGVEEALPQLPDREARARQRSKVDDPAHAARVDDDS